MTCLCGTRRRVLADSGLAWAGIFPFRGAGQHLRVARSRRRTVVLPAGPRLQQKL